VAPLNANARKLVAPGRASDLDALYRQLVAQPGKQGGGIGLAMVRHLIHANGSTVRYARPIGRGARFVITF
jgi:signal transduction histidine kinase